MKNGGIASKFFRMKFSNRVIRHYGEQYTIGFNNVYYRCAESGVSPLLKSVFIIQSDLSSPVGVTTRLINRRRQ